MARRRRKALPKHRGALASELSSGMPDDHDTALHSTRVQPIRPINLARAGADGPEPRRQVHLHCVFEALPQSSFGFREIPTLWWEVGSKLCHQHLAVGPLYKERC